MAEVRKISRSGHSLMIALPPAYLRAIDLGRHDVVLVELVGKTIVLSRALSQRQLAADEATPGAKSRE